MFGITGQMKKSDTNYNQALIGNNKSLKAYFALKIGNKLEGSFEA